MKLPHWVTKASRSPSCLLLAGLGPAHGSAALYSAQFVRAVAVAVFPALFLLRTTREEVYNILWALVFAFATINILSLGARKFEQNRRGLSFGEVLAVLVVLLSIVMLGWELLYLFNILPIRFTPS
jgi:hypothetical protein